MPGDEWQRRANFRWFRAFMTAHPGKKLLFMGTEFGQWQEWRDEHSLDWHLLEQPEHRALHDFDRELNQLYASRAVLHASDCDPAGFGWIDLHSADQSVYVFLRRDPQQPARPPLICAFNCTPVPRDGYLIGVPEAGPYRKILDSDAARFGGSGYNQQERFVAESSAESRLSVSAENRPAAARRGVLRTGPRALGVLRRPFGDSGLTVPALGFGAMQIGDPQLDERHVARMLNHVLDSGMTLIDTARSYGLAEERIGRHIAHRRAEFVLSTKVGYDVAGVPDWTYECVVRGVDAARAKLRTDVIDIVHLHSCTLEILQAGAVTRALNECRSAGKIRIAAYSGDAAALAFASESGGFRSLQASVNLCDQQALPVLQRAQRAGLGTIAKRSLGGRPWTGTFSGDFAHDEYRRRFAVMKSALRPDTAGLG